MTSKKNLQVPWLLAPVWKDFPMTKGLGHHRTPVGIILAAKSKLTCTLESNSLDQVQIRLLNNDRQTEDMFVIETTLPGRSAAFSIDSVSVPFLECEYLKKDPEDKRTISVSYPSNSKILPIYHFEDNEEEFFKLWDTQDAEFGYVESDFFGLLIPKIDKEAARKLPDGKHLDDVILFYDKIFTIFNQLIGLSFEETGTDQNVRNRFFIKADKNGFGMAYYDHRYTASTSESIAYFWLDINPTNWGALHEIGHGYELKNLSDETFSTGEVWNNILVFFYQAIIFGKEISTKGSKQSSMNITEALRSEIDVENWGLLEKLSFLIHMFLKAGQKSFTRFNQRTRQEYAGNTYYASGTRLVEKIMHFFAIDFLIDVYPFMKLARADIGQEQLFEHYYVLSHVAYPLNYLIDDTKEINAVKNRLNLLFETSLVTPTDLSSTKLKNDFTVTIDHHIYDCLCGDELKLIDGSQTVAKKRIFSQIITLKDVPIGVYKVYITPNPLNVKFLYDDFYAVVHASKLSELFLTAKRMKVPFLLPDKIQFHGVGDSNFATLSANPFQHILKFTVYSSSPHSYYENEKYVSLDIKNEQNEVVFSKSIEGNSSAIGVYDIYMEGQLEVEIFHAETKSRLKTEDPSMDAIIDRENTTNNLIVNELGFQNKKKITLKELLEKSFLNKIAFVANKIKSKISLFVRPHCQPKYNLLLAVEAFEYLFKKNSPYKSLRDKYKDCLPPDYSFQLVDALVNLNRISTERLSTKTYSWKLINYNTGKSTTLPSDKSSETNTTISFFGFNSKLAAKLFIDILESAVCFQVLDTDPHYRYENYDYIEVTIRNNENKVIFTKTLQGTKATVEKYKISFTDFVEIDIFHVEPSRLRFEKPTIADLMVRNKSTHTLTLTKRFLNVDYIYEITQTDTGIKLPLPNDESAISCSKINFMGLYDKYAGVLYIDTQRSVIHFNAVSINPHSRYGNEPYFGLKVLKGKKVLFDKTINGLHAKAEEFKIPFDQRVELEVFHAEPTRLRSHNLSMRYLIDRKNTTNKYSLSKEIARDYCKYEIARADSNEKVEFPIGESAILTSILKFLGKGDEHIATLYLDLRNDRILFSVLSSKPHEEFKDKVYLSVTIHKEDKEVIFSKKIKGIGGTKQNFTISFTGNIEIDVFHEEPKRLISDNPKIVNIIDHKKTMNNFLIKKSIASYRKIKNKEHMIKHNRKVLKRRKSV